MPVELRQLRSFLHLAETLSFSRGAERAHISQSSMTEQIQRLEDIIGVRLVDRSRRHVKLTAAGKVLQSRARALFELADQTVEDTRLAGQVARQQIRIGYSEMALSSVMPNLLQRYRSTYPNTETILVEQSSMGAEQALLDHHIDCAFVPGIGHHPEIGSLEIGRDMVLACFTETSPLARHSTLTFRHLANEALILPSKGSQFGDCVVNAFAKAGVETRIVARINRASAILTLASAGEGVGFIPLALTGLVPNGVLIRPLGRPQLSIAFSLLWRRAQPGRAVEELANLAQTVVERPRG